MKDYGHLKSFLIITLIIGLTTLFAGCGGGNSDVVNSSVINNNQTAATGSFSITVNVPKPDKGLFGSYIPSTRKTLIVTITGEAIPTNAPVEDALDLDEGSTLTISGIPVGLNVASIKVLDGNKKVIAQRNVGFFLKGNEKYTAGTIEMGIGIDSTGSCTPSIMEIPRGTELYFENQDTASDHTISFNNGAIVIGPIAKVATSTEPNTPVVFDAKSYKFDTIGTYVYDTGKGSPGQISVFDVPVVSSIDNGNSDPNMKNKDELQVNTEIYLTINGSGFGSDASSVTGQVIFTQVNPVVDANEIVKVYGTFDANTSWSDTKIKTKVKLSEGTYLVQVAVRGGTSADKVYYYRATMHQMGDMKFSIGQIADLFMVVNKENVAGGDYGVPYLAYDDKDDSLYTHAYSRYDYSKNQWERKYYEPLDPPEVPGLLGTTTARGGAHFMRFNGSNPLFYGAVIFDVPSNDPELVAIPSYRQLFITYNGEAYIPVSPFPTIKVDPNDPTKYTVTELWDVNEVSITVDENNKLYIAYTMKNNGSNNNDLTKYYRCYTSIYTPGSDITPKPYWNRDLAGTYRTSYVSSIDAIYNGHSAKDDFKGLSGNGDVEIVKLKLDKNRKFLSYKDGPNQKGVTVMTDYESIDGDSPETFTEPLVSGTNAQRYPLDWASGGYPKENTWRVVGKAGFSRKEASAISLDIYNHAPYVVFRDSNTNGLSLMKYTGKYSYSDYSGVPTGWQLLGKEGFASGSADVSLFIYNYAFGKKGIPYVAYSDSNGHLMKYEYTTDEFKGIWSEIGHITGFSEGTCSPLSLFIYDNNGYPVPFLGYQDQSINQTGSVKKFNILPTDPNDINNY